MTHGAHGARHRLKGYPRRTRSTRGRTSARGGPRRAPRGHRLRRGHAGGRGRQRWRRRRRRLAGAWGLHILLGSTSIAICSASGSTCPAFDAPVVGWVGRCDVRGRSAPDSQRAGSSKSGEKSMSTSSSSTRGTVVHASRLLGRRLQLHDARVTGRRRHERGPASTTGSRAANARLPRGPEVAGPTCSLEAMAR